MHLKLLHHRTLLQAAVDDAQIHFLELNPRLCPQRLRPQVWMIERYCVFLLTHTHKCLRACVPACARVVCVLCKYQCAIIQPHHDFLAALGAVARSEPRSAASGTLAPLPPAAAPMDALAAEKAAQLELEKKLSVMAGLLKQESSKVLDALRADNQVGNTWHNYASAFTDIFQF